MALVFGPGAMAPVAASPAAAQQSPEWLINNSAINLINSYLGNSFLTTNAFDTPSTLVLHGMPAGWTGQRTDSFDAYGPASVPGSFLYALDNGTIPAGTSYVLYDNESWTMTPPAEQEDPGDYMAAFVQTAHEFGYQAILAPSVDLATVMPCYDPQDSSWDNYLYDCDLPQLAAAAEPDVLEIQSQRYENTPSGSKCGCYQWFVDQAAAEADAESPVPEILAGLSSNPEGALTTAQTLYTDTLDTLGTVAGYWLNVPQQGQSCPTCQPSGDPDVAAGLLELMGYVDQGPQSIKFTSSPPVNAAYGGPTYSVTAKGGGSGNPVVFSVDPSSGPGVCAVSGSTVSFTGTGTCVIDANQAGNATYLPAPQVTQSFTVGPAAQAISFAPPAATGVGESATLSATGGGSGNPVVFSLDPSSGAGVCSIAADGVTISYGTVGTCVIDANQAGGPDYTAAPQVVESFGVGPGVQAITFTSTPPSDASYAGPSYSVSASGGASGNPVVFSLDPSSDPGVCNVTGSTVSFTGVGNCVIDANQLGDADYLAASTAVQSVAVGQASQSIVFGLNTRANATFDGPPDTLDATGGASGNPVVFSVDPSSDPGVCSVAGDVLSFTGVGNCVVDANQAGDDLYAAAATASETFPVGPAPQAITFTSTAPTDAVFGGPAYEVSATGGPSGEPVVFSVDPSSDPGVCTISGATVSFGGAGTCIVDANQAGSADYAAASVATQSFTVGQGSQSITFTSSPPPGAAFGGTYPVAASGGGSGNPVVFSIDPSSDPGVCSVSGSTVSFTGVGNCIVDANQAGDADYAAAPVATQSVAVGQGSQTIAFTTSPPTDVYFGGPSYTIGATGGGSGNPVVFSIDPSSDPGVCSVSGVAVSFTGAGTCVIDADQAGDADYAAAPQAMQSFSVGEAGQSITFTSSPPTDAYFGGPAYTVSATGGGSGNPVVFSVDPSSGPGVCAVSGVTVSFTGVGICLIDANQAGDGDYAAAPQLTQSFPVVQAPQSISFTSSPPADATYGGPGYTVSATGGGSGNPVVFSVDPSSGPGVCALSGSTVSFSGTGTCVIDANQAGNADYAAAPQSAQSFTVGQASQSISFTSAAPSGAVYGGGYTVAATGGGSGNPVVFSIDPSSGTGVCAVSGATVSFAGVGTCVIDADQAGDADFAAAPQSAQSFTVGQASQSISFTSAPPSSAVYGGAAYTVAATGGGSGIPVSFTSGAPAVCTVSGSSVAFTGVGTCVILADEGGSADYAPAAEASQSFAVGQASQTITFTSAPPIGAYYQGPTYTVSASGGGSGNPVVFSVDPSSGPGVCALSGATVSFTGVGTCVIDAGQTGNANYMPAPAAMQSFRVGLAPQVITFTSTAPSSAVYDGPAYTVTATGGGSGNPVAFSIDPSSGAGVCVLNGSTVSFTGVGTCVIDANQAAGGDYAAAAQAEQSFRVAQAAQSVTFTSAAPSGAVYGGPTYTVTASGGGSGKPVTFSSGAPGVCSVTGSTVSFTGAGTCVIDANQAGDADYSAAPQATQSFKVGQASQTITFTSSAPGGAVYGGPTYTVTATGGGSGNPVTFSSGTPGVCAVSGGVVSFVGTGSCTVEANQAGNSDYAAAKAATQRFSVGKASQSITFTSPPPANPTVGGPAYTLAAIGGGSGNPITFSSGSTNVCAVTGSQVTFLATGNCVVDANQAGNADYNAAKTASQKFKVAKASQSIRILSAAGHPVVGGPSYDLDASGGASGNPVVFTTETPKICTVSGDSVSFVAAGECTIRASQAGNRNYLAAVPTTQSFKVAPAPRSPKRRPFSLL